MPAWTWPPDWSVAMMERLQWRTDVIPAARGEEQRRALRIDPRQFVEFTSVVQGAERSILEALLWDQGAELWSVPLWFDGMELEAPLASGSTVIPLDPAGRSFRAGDRVLIIGSNPREFDDIAIDSIGSDITLQSSTGYDWPAGTRVYPSRDAFIESQADVSRFTGETGVIRTLWRMDKPIAWGVDSPTLYRSIAVLEVRPNWTQDPTFSYDRKLSVLDGGVGRVRVVDDAEMPLPLQTMSFALPTRSDIAAWKGRLAALRGRQGSMWVPTWASDLQVVAPVLSADTTIDVAYANYTNYLAEAPNRQDIRLEHVDGGVYYARITASEVISDTVERLTIDSPLGDDLDVSSFALVSFMGLSRSEADQHEFIYFTGDAADTRFSARGFRHDL